MRKIKNMIKKEDIFQPKPFYTYLLSLINLNFIRFSVFKVLLQQTHRRVSENNLIRFNQKLKFRYKFVNYKLKF